MTWFIGHEAEIKRLWADGESYTAIGELYNVTRSAVAGVIRRWGVQAREKGHKRGPTRVHTENINRKRLRNFGSVWSSYPDQKPEPFKARVAVVPSLCIPITKVRDDQCRYIAGDDRLCCGHPVRPDHSWCPAHCEIVYTPPRERTERQSSADVARSRYQRSSRRSEATEWMAEGV